MKKIKLYSKANCPLCDEIRSLVSLFDVEVTEIDIEKDALLMEKYLFEIPVLKIGEKELDYRSISYKELEKRLQ